MVEKLEYDLLKMEKNTKIELSVENLCKRYDDVVAVDNVSFEIHKGEFITLLGPSGSGKSTILMGIAGFLNLDGGNIFINGKNVNTLPPRKRNIGMVFQSYSLFPHMNVFENIAFPLKMRKVAKSKIEEKVRNVIEKVQLIGFDNRRINQLSGGQQQRVALARALVYEPTILLMDEPFGALDKKLREEMQYELKDIQKRLNITILFVTHDQSEALILSSRIAIMNFGKIIQMGNPIDLYNKPNDEFVSTFLGESNIISGKIDKSGLFVSKKEETFSFNIKKNPGNYELMVRPEWIEINSENDSNNGWSAKITERIFLGDGFRYIIKIGENLELIVKAYTHTNIYEVGDMIKVNFIEGLPVFIQR
jgi:ABC-type Fe3+/spermidine/putrescine transport system ATPase subunit